MKVLGERIQDIKFFWYNNASVQQMGPKGESTTTYFQSKTTLLNSPMACNSLYPRRCESSTKNPIKPCTCVAFNLDPLYKLEKKKTLLSLSLFLSHITSVFLWARLVALASFKYNPTLEKDLQCRYTDMPGVLRKLSVLLRSKKKSSKPP